MKLLTKIYPKASKIDEVELYPGNLIRKRRIKEKEQYVSICGRYA
jgi:hypothetical protein